MKDRQKELKLAYKLNPPPMGVYLIKNLINGKIFISSGMNLPAKKNSLQFLLDLHTHPDQLNLASHPNLELRADWHIYGSEAFKFEILETIKPDSTPKTNWRKTVYELEDKWLDKLKPYGDKGYNKDKKR